uniref:Interferon, lambda receptor 1 n=1 Tax=Xenopus tropicalis TaxID=8364 RepID=A0A803KAV0_XENTR
MAFFRSDSDLRVFSFTHFDKQASRYMAKCKQLFFITRFIEKNYINGHISRRSMQLYMTTKVQRNSKWNKKNCRNITGKECDLTCLFDYTHNYIVGVRTKFGSSMSKWEEIKDISYIFTVDPEAPTLEVKFVDKSMYINAAVKTPHCIKDIYNLKYNIEASLNNAPKQIKFKEVKMNSAVILDTTGLSGNYCVEALTVFTMEQKKISQPSKPFCHLFKDEEYNSGHNWSFAVLILFPILLISGILLYCYIKSRHPGEAKRPVALDFSRFSRELCTSEFSEMTPQQYDKITTVEISGQNLNIDADYELSHFRYTKTHPALREFGEDGSKSQMSGGYKLSSLRSSLKDHSCERCSTSDFSCEESESSSGPHISRLLTLHDMQKTNLDHTQDEDEDKIKEPDPNELLLSTVKSDFWNMSSLGSKSFCPLNQSLSVRFETLKIEGKSGQVENSDGESSDQCFSEFEDSTEDLNEESDTEDQLSSNSNLQKLRCSGYESRGYMAR